MKKILLILTLLFSLAASAQVDTTKPITPVQANGYSYKHLQAIYALLFPTDTLRMKSDWRAVAFKNDLPYYWDGARWNAFGTGSGSADSAIFATLFRLDTAKTNIRTTLNNKIDSLRRVGLNVQAYKNSTWTTQFTDSVGSGTAADSLTFVDNELTLYQTGGSDLNVHITPSILNIDSTFNPIAGQVNDTTWIQKSLQVQWGGSTVTPTITDSTISWNITGVAGNDSAYINAYLTTDSTALILVRDNNLQDTFHFRVDTTGWNLGADSSIYATIYRTDTLAQNIRDEIAALPAPTLQQVFATESNNALMDGNFKVNVNGHDIDFDEAVNGFITVVSYFSMVGGDSLNMQSGQDNRILLKSDTIFIKPILGNLNIDSLNSGSSSDSVLVWDQSTGMVKKRNSSDFGGVGGTYYIGTYNSQTINGDGASIVGDSIYMQEFSAESPGLVPAGGSGTTYLRGDATWQTISSGSPAGNFNNVQVNRNGSFAALGSDSLSVSGSTLSSKLELSLIGATPTVNFGTAAGNPEIAATASALIFRRNDVGAYIDVTLGTLNANSFATTGNGSIAGKLSITTGTNKSAGTGTLASGTATISTNNVTANSLIFIQYTSCSSCGSTYISAKTASTSFVVTSTNGSDASTFNWWIIN